MKLPILEKHVQDQILDYLKSVGIFHWRQNTGFNSGEYETSKNGKYGGAVHKWAMRFGYPGISDILGIMRDGRFLAIEVKRPGGKPTQAQLDFIENINLNGGLAFVADDLDTVIEKLAINEE